MTAAPVPFTALMTKDIGDAHAIDIAYQYHFYPGWQEVLDWLDEHRLGHNVDYAVTTKGIAIRADHEHLAVQFRLRFG